MSFSNTDLHFMDAAFNEMLKSISEHTDKVDPLVGAVIVANDGRELGRESRGALRDGEHAEHTLIERVLSGENLNGSTLYVTLEPCTLRNAPKVPCARKVVNARIARVFIGMLDPNPDIQGAGVRYLQDNGVDVQLFPNEITQKIAAANQKFVDHWNNCTTKASETDSLADPSKLEQKIVSGSRFSDLSNENINEFVLKLKIPIQEQISDHREFLIRRNYLSDDGSDTPTMAGMLLFGKSPEQHLVHARVEFEAKIGAQSVEETVSGPLLSIPMQVVVLLERHMRHFTVIDKLERKKVPEYPTEALREAIVNALIHREYKEGACVSVVLDSDRVVIRSPGLPPSPLTIEKFRNFDLFPLSRNPRIAAAFREFGLMEERGRGIIWMRKKLLEHGLESPRFEFTGGYLEVSIMGQASSASKVIISENVLEHLDERNRLIIQLIAERGAVKTSECSAELGITDKATHKRLKFLIESGFINRSGAGKTTRYTVELPA